MNERERRKLDKALRRVDSKLKHKADEALADLRNWWESWSPKQREAFKKWIGSLARLKRRQPPLAPYMFLRLSFSEPIGEDEYHTFAPSITAIKKAIRFWERGEPFIPNSLAELTN